LPLCWLEVIIRRILEGKIMTEQLPDRLSTDQNSPFFNGEILQREVGIRFNGIEKTNVEEYCISEGWVRLVAGNAKDRRGNPMTVKLKGTVEAYYKD
jgi:hypothetical protein